MDDNYINSGIMLMNLDYIRKHKLDNRMIELLNNNYYEYPDQDVINIVCKGKIKYISNIYNSTETTGIVDNAKVVHYIRDAKGWKKQSPRSEIWFNYHRQYIEELFKGGGNMVKVEVIENFHLARFNELKNIIRKAVDEPNKLFVGDIFECTPDMAKYLMGENALKRPFVRVIEIITVNEEPKIRKSSKNILKKRSREKST